MKIAFITDDGKTISRHFGRAGQYLVVELAEGQILKREMRDKIGHNQYVKKDKDVATILKSIALKGGGMLCFVRMRIVGSNPTYSLPFFIKSY